MSYHAEKAKGGVGLAMIGATARRTRGIEALAQGVWRQLDLLPAAARYLAAGPDLAVIRATAPRRLPVCDFLPALEALSTPATRALVRDFVVAADDLEWRQTYDVADFGAGFLDRYGWTELIGLRGPIPSETIACGFLMLGPEIEYPAHAHEAEELYLPIAGEALWMRGESGFVARPPGEPIEHPAWTPHAMRTLREPMLAIYLWRGGDLAAKSRILAR